MSRPLTLSRRSLASKRSADNELYDRGCDLIEAAMAIHQLGAAAEMSADVGVHAPARLRELTRCRARWDGDGGSR